MDDRKDRHFLERSRMPSYDIPKHKRAGAIKRMTTAIGMLTQVGVLVSADTEETGAMGFAQQIAPAQWEVQRAEPAQRDAVSE